MTPDEFALIKDVATDREIRIVNAVFEHGSHRKAAEAVGCVKSNVAHAIESLRKRAAKLGLAPGHFTDGVAPGYRMGKVTIQRSNGVVERIWERQHPTNQRISEEIEALAAHAMSDTRGLSPLAKGPLFVSDKLLATYWFGDPHFGLCSSSEDAADDTDIDDSDRLTRAGIDALVSKSPATGKAVLCFIGDNTHANDSSALTPAHKNPLDVDPRGFGAAFLSVSRAICYSVTRALEKHSEVECWVLPGNHDPDAAFAIAVAVSFWFENNPRVKVRLSREYLWWLKFGKNLIAAHHGDKIKAMDLHGVLSNDCKEIWADVDFRYVWQGHIHHDTVTEYQMTRFESLRTLSKQDKWHRGKGFRSMRDTRAVIYHEEGGEVERYTVSAAMLDA
jgi:hypothetical protein